MMLSSPRVLVVRCGAVVGRSVRVRAFAALVPSFQTEHCHNRISRQHYHHRHFHSAAGVFEELLKSIKNDPTSTPAATTPAAPAGALSKQPPSSLQGVTTTASEKSDSKNVKRVTLSKQEQEFKALERAAEESIQIFQTVQKMQSAKRTLAATEKSDFSTSSPSSAVSWEQKAQELRAKEAMDVACTMHRISRIRYLKGAVLAASNEPEQHDNRNNRKIEARDQMVAELHCAMILVISWCLDVLQAQAQANAPLMRSVLDIVRKAQRLELPLHLPLYHRLSEQVAAHASMLNGNKDDAVAIIFEILVFAEKSGANLKRKKNAAAVVVVDKEMSPLPSPSSLDLSKEWLEPILEQFMNHPSNRDQPQLEQVDRLLNKMKSYYGISQVSVDTTLSILLRLRSICREALKNSHPLNDSAVNIVKWLEPSLCKIASELLIPQDTWYDSDDDDQDNDEDSDDDDNDEDSDENEEYGPPDGAALVWLLRSLMELGLKEYVLLKRRPSRLDLMVDKFLNRDLSQGRAKQLMSEIILYTNLKDSQQEEDLLPTLDVPKSIEQTKKDEDDYSKNDENDATVYHSRYTDNGLPDIMGQVVKWNGDDMQLVYRNIYKSAFQDNLDYEDD